MNSMLAFTSARPDARPWVRGLATLVLIALALTGIPAQAVRIKEVAAIQGVRSNSLTGYGLVVGLDGTGDQTTQMPYTTQSLSNYMQQLGITLPAGSAQLQLKNVAAVIVTAQLPAFAQPGQTIDINVSSIGNAKSLKGGTLVTTPLRGVDGEIYALAQGNLVVGGAGASAGGSKVQINHLSAGRIPGGAQVERSVPTPLQDGDTISLGLNASDFQTARHVAAAKVVMNTRTGSIVLNQAVTLGPCAIAHGNLSVTISSTPVISQPNALSGGQTVVAQKADIQIKQDPGIIMNLPASPQLADVVRALNALGATPQDLLAILQAIKAAGALNAELEVI